MLRLFKQVFTAVSSFSQSLASVFKVHDHTKCVSLSNQPCIAGPPLIDSNSDKYYLFLVKINRYNKSCCSFHDLSNRICVLDKIEDINFFNF